MLVMLAALLVVLLAPAAHAQAPAVGVTGPGGGKVFYVDANIYLEAAPSNWGGETTGRRYATGGNATITVPGGATGTAIGTGYANSVAIANQTGNVAATCAAVAAREYTGGGLTDWFLPSKDEILQLYAQRVIAGFPAGQVYWSSTEKDNDEAWTLWDNGTGYARPKDWGFRTRPIRMGTIGGTPTITTAGTLVAVHTTYGSPSPSPTQFMVSGTDLIAAITVTPPTGYEVSKSESSGYAGSGTAITVGSAPTVNTTTIYVRLAATADVAGSPYSGDIVCSSPSAVSKNVATVASTVTPTGGTPTITTAGTLVAVDTTYGSPSPSPTQFMVSGTDLDAGITVTPPAGYQVSKSESSGYAGSGTAITVGSPPTVNSTTIYVRLAATAGVAGSPYSGDIVCSSISADSQNVATVASTVSKAEQAPITFAPASPQIYNTVQVLSASGGSGTGAFSYAVQSGPGTISDGTNLTATADTGTIVVRATKAADDNYNEATQDANVRAQPATGVTYAVGDTGPGGGKVFYVDANIYLEAAPSNWGSPETNARPYATGGDAPGSNATITVPGGATGTAIGTGYANSVAIANQVGNVAASCAAVAAREYTGGGLSDWFLPSKDELAKLYAQRANADFPNGGVYWSSSETSATKAWTLWDGTMNASMPSKTWSFRTRPIRMGTIGGTPTITTAGTLVAVDTTYGSPSPSPTQFMVSGTDLIAAITVTPPTGYEVSVSESSGYAGSGTAITVGIAPTVNTTTIYVRLAATAGVAGSPYSGDIVCSSPSAVSKNVATVASTVTPTGGTPTITTAGTLVAVDTTYGSPSPSPTQFMVSGTDLDAGITVTPPAGYQVSKSESSGYAGSGTAITVGSPPTVNSTTIYVRLAATAGVAGSPYSGDIVCSSPSADSKYVATVASTVSKAEQAPITFAPASPQIYNTVQVLSASGGSGTGAFSYAVQSGPGTISDGTNLTATADTGTIMVRATKAADDNYNEATQDANVVAQPATGVTYAVGDTGPGGGKVFYVSGKTYLEAAPSNWGGETATRTWASVGNQTTTVPGGATGTAIGTGFANTEAIVAQVGNVAGSCAAVAARNYQGNGLTDWFLPSKDEILQLYAQRVIAGFPVGQSYWSSTEKDNDQAWTLWDSGTLWDNPGKNWSLRTRPIRMGTNGGTGGTTYADWATANGVIGDPNGDSNNDGVQNGIAYFMNDTGRITNPSLNAGNTVTWTNGGKIPSSAYGTQFVVQTSTDLVNWTPVAAGDLSTNTDGPGGSLTYTLPSGAVGGKSFVRLVVMPD